MWRPAVVRFGMLACTLAVACSGSSRSTGTGESTIGNRGPLVASSEPDIAAAYWCSIRSGEYEYPAMPCVIRKERGRYVLAKLAGSQRFRGVVRTRADSEGFTFDGEFYCPWGDCTQPLHGVFMPIDDGRLRGTFTDQSIVVTMTRTSGVEAFGGSGYGGAGYGGDGYGGVGYGGWGYGGH